MAALFIYAVHFYPWPSPALAIVSSEGRGARASNASRMMRLCSAACAAG
jgi:hypothetical protein